MTATGDAVSAALTAMYGETLRADRMIRADVAAEVVREAFRPGKDKPLPA